MIPSAAALAITFGLGCAVGTVERIAQGWGGHNMLWRLRTTSGDWAIKQVGRELGPDPDAAFAIELAAYAGGVRMPRPIPTVGGTCLATLGRGRYRCHEWLDGTALPWHGHTPQTAAAVGALLASLHRLRLPWSRAWRRALPSSAWHTGPIWPKRPARWMPPGVSIWTRRCPRSNVWRRRWPPGGPLRARSAATEICTRRICYGWRVASWLWWTGTRPAR